MRQCGGGFGGGAAGHEETERLERLVARDFHAEAGTHGARLAQAHRVAQCVEAIAARSGELLEYYADEDETRAEEIAGLGGPNPFAAFYARLRELGLPPARAEVLAAARVLLPDEAQLLADRPSAEPAEKLVDAAFSEEHEALLLGAASVTRNALTNSSRAAAAAATAASAAASAVAGASAGLAMPARDEAVERVADEGRTGAEFALA